MKAIILAGGFGTRLKERVPDLPKPMAPVAGQPFLRYIIDHLINGGIKDIIISVGYLSEVIISYFKHSYRGAAITYVIESVPLGTGGAIANAVLENNEEAVLVVNGDTFVNIDYNGFLKWYQLGTPTLALVLKNVDDVSRYGSVTVSNDIVSGFLEKGKVGAGLINAGVYIIPVDIFSKYGLIGRFSLESDFLQKYCIELSLRAFITNAYFIDIGVPEDYERAQYELASAFSTSDSSLMAGIKRQDIRLT